MPWGGIVFLRNTLRDLIGALRLHGFLAQKKTPTTLGPLEGPRHMPNVRCEGGRFLTSEVPLCEPSESAGSALLGFDAPTVLSVSRSRKPVCHSAD